MCDLVHSVTDAAFKLIENKLYSKAMQYNVRVQQNFQGDYVLKTVHETWIIVFNAIVDEQNANITLYHKSRYFAYSKKCGTTRYPDYHVQYRRTQTVVDVLRYVCRHDAYRYNAHKRCVTSNCVSAAV